VIALAAGVVWAGYGVASWGWCLVMGYDVPLTGWFSPFAPFTWPADGNPGFVRKGQIFPGGSPGTASASTSTGSAASSGSSSSAGSPPDKTKTGFSSEGRGQALGGPTTGA
jgi:hypothetical protein